MKNAESHHIHWFRTKKNNYAAGESILDATLKAGINHTYACGGHGKCSTCRVV